MTWLEKWFLRRLCRKIVIQGPRHTPNITEYYRYIRNAAQREFKEDTQPTLNSFLEKCHKDAGKTWIVTYCDCVPRGVAKEIMFRID